MNTQLQFKKMQVLLIVAFTCCFLAPSNAQWHNVRVGGGGAITSILAHPKVQSLYFATTDVGTPYRWNSTTQSWEGLFYDMPANNWSRPAAGNLAFDPNDATGNTLYATMGGMYTMGTLLKSMDRGTTWKDCKLSIEVKPNNDQTYGQRLAVDPNNSNVVYVTTRRITTGVSSTNGTFKSIDAGNTWTKINDLCGAFLIFDRSQGTTEGVTKNIFIGCADGIYLSINGGVDFTKMNGSPVNSDRADLHSNGTMYVNHFKSVSKWNGTAWSSITPNPTYAYGAIAVNPNNGDQVIVAQKNLDPYVWDQYITNDGGSTWKKSLKTADISENPWFTEGIGAGIKTFCWDPFDQNMVWFGDYSNTFQTTNIWQEPMVLWKSRTVGEEETVGIGNILCPPSGVNLLLSNVADVGGFDHKSLTSPPTTGMGIHFPWTASGGTAGNMTGVAVQETNPNFIARVGRHGWNGKGYSGHSINGGDSYIKWNCPLNASGGRIAVSANSTTMVWATQSGPVYRSTDLGTTWTSINTLPSNIIQKTDIFGAGSVFPLAADKVNGEKFYVYYGGFVYFSTDGGATFTQGGTVPAPYGTDPLALETTPGKEGEIWLALNKKGLYRSKDSGASFSAVSKVQLANSVSIGKSSPENPANPAIYVYGTVNNISDGLFRSNDDGATWQTVSAPLHTGINVYSMGADRQVYGRVFFNTTGNGIRYVEDMVDTTAPSSPGNLATMGTTATSTRLSWSPSNDNVNVVGYNIYKDGVFLASAPLYSYIVNGLSIGNTYVFSVKAKDPAGNLSEASVITLEIPIDYVQPINIALNKPATANIAPEIAYRANDGDVATFWTGPDSQIGYNWQVDLENNYNITGAEMIWNAPKWIYKYLIEVSTDNINWTIASDMRANYYFGEPSEINNFTANGQRYVRITIAGWGNGGYYTSAKEFRLFGTLTITGTKELQTNNVRIYPNPTTDNLNVYTKNSTAEISIYTLNGTLVYRNKTINNNLTIPVSNWSKGVYLIKIKDDNGVTAEKVIIQ